MNIDMIKERLEKLFENPNDDVELRRLVRDVVYELPKHDLDKLNEFQDAVMRSKLNQDKSERTAFARGLLLGLSEFCQSFKDVIERVSERKFIQKSSEEVCPEWKKDFILTVLGSSYGYPTPVFKDHFVSCLRCYTLIDKFLKTPPPIIQSSLKNDLTEILGS